MKYFLGCLFLTSIASASCVGPYCWDDTGPSISGRLNVGSIKYSGDGSVQVSSPSTSGGSSSVSVTTYSVTSLNNNNNINATTIFTTPSKGLYMLNVYTVTTSTDSGATAGTFNLAWTDDHGAQTQAIASLGITSFSLSAGQQAFEAVANSTVTYSVTGGANYGAARYNLYLNILRFN